jgi:hypothetical protein
VQEESLVEIRSELSRYQHEANGMRQELEHLRNDIDTARYQLGVGDIGDKSDSELAVQIGDLSKQERNLIAKSDSPVGRRVEKVYQVIDSTEAILSHFSQDVENEAIIRVGKMRQQVRAEKDQVAAYRKELIMLSDEAEEVVGGVAFENFLHVRDRFYELVLKADVGLIDVVWLFKEEHTNRITNLSKARVDEIKRLDEKFQEVKTGP